MSVPHRFEAVRADLYHEETFKNENYVLIMEDGKSMSISESRDLVCQRMADRLADALEGLIDRHNYREDGEWHYELLKEYRGHK